MPVARSANGNEHKYHTDMDNNLDKRGKRTPLPAASLFVQVQQKIIVLRDCQVILDADVAELYGVETMRINEAVKNNPEKFPEGKIKHTVKRVRRPNDADHTEVE